MDWKELSSVLNNVEWDLDTVISNLKTLDFSMEHGMVEADTLTNRRDMLVAKLRRVQEEVIELGMEV